MVTGAYPGNYVLASLRVRQPSQSVELSSKPPVLLDSNIADISNVHLAILKTLLARELLQSCKFPSQALIVKHRRGRHRHSQVTQKRASITKRDAVENVFLDGRTLVGGWLREARNLHLIICEGIRWRCAP